MDSRNPEADPQTDYDELHLLPVYHDPTRDGHWNTLLHHLLLFLHFLSSLSVGEIRDQFN